MPTMYKRILQNSDVGDPTANAVPTAKWTTRTAGRIIVFDRTGEHILLLRSETHGTYELPGGGVEGCETTEKAARREALEETGYETVIRIRDLAEIVEYRANACSHNSSRLFVGHITGTRSKTTPTTKELLSNFTCMWVPVAHVISTIRNAPANDERTRFRRTREALFVAWALEHLALDAAA